jgi:hypothetical protein
MSYNWKDLDAICEGIEQDEENRQWDDEEFVDLNKIDNEMQLGYCVTCDAEEKAACQAMGHNILHDVQEEEPEEDFDECDICAVHGEQDDCPNCGLKINEEGELA